MNQFCKYLTVAVLFVTSSLMLAAESGATEVVIKQVPLTYKDIALKDGHEMYDHLCAACHGVTGKGDGPAAPALSNPVPDLTHFVAASGGDCQAQLERVISGMDRTVHEDMLGMPLWFREFQYVRVDKFGRPRTMYANQKIHSLAEYVEELVLAGAD